MGSALNWIDYSLLAVFFISVLGGLMRGGVREIISVVTWIAAFIIAGLFSHSLAAYFSSSPEVKSALSSASTSTFGVSAASQVSMLALGLSFSILFFATIIIGSLFGYFANRAVEGGGVSIGNRFIGGIFGLGRGYLIVLLIIFLAQLTPFSQQTVWSESSLVKGFQPMVQWLENIVQPGFESLKSQMGQKLEDMTSGVQNSVMGAYQRH